MQNFRQPYWKMIRYYTPHVIRHTLLHPPYVIRIRLLHPWEIWLVAFRIYHICKIKLMLSKYMISSFMIGGTVPILCIISLCLFRPKSTCGGLKLALFIGAVLPTYFLLGLCCPLTFYWGCAAHLLFIGAVLPTYFLLGLCCPLTFYSFSVFVIIHVIVVIVLFKVWIIMLL